MFMLKKIIQKKVSQYLAISEYATDIKFSLHLHGMSFIWNKIYTSYFYTFSYS